MGEDSRRDDNQHKEGMAYKECWLAKSHRWQHLIYAIPVGLVFSINGAIGCASGMEYKDHQWGGKPDIVDWLLTVAGGLIGEALRVGVALLIFK